MTEIYWLTRLAAIYSICKLGTIIGAVLFIMGIILIPLGIDEFCDDDKDEKKLWRYVKMAVAAWVVCIIGVIFIPSQKEMLAIYGIGNTIDYIKNNDKAKELPDKVVDALTKYLDSPTENDEDR